jgi:hypothetical protein
MKHGEYNLPFLVWLRLSLIRLLMGRIVLQADVDGEGNCTDCGVRFIGVLEDAPRSA